MGEGDFVEESRKLKKQEGEGMRDRGRREGTRKEDDQMT
jgi:hypothetical protein